MVGGCVTASQMRHLWKSQSSQSRPLSPAEEEAGKAAILEKVMKGRQPTDLMLRCTILDAEGNVKTISGQFKKSDLSVEHQLNPRDLRKIDSRVPNLVPTILVRKQAILINILHIRALIKADTVVLFDTYGSADSRLHSVYLYHLEVFIRTLVGGLLAELEDSIDHDRFKRLLHYSRRLASFHNRAKLVGEAIDEVLTQDEDLSAMYLTDKHNGVEHDPLDHEELEILLESFSKQVEEIVNEVENLEANVQSTQEIVELILDSNRNALLALDLQVSIATFGVGTGALLAGLLGMNLTNHFESHPYAFFAMTGVAGFASFMVAFLGFRKLVKMRKIGLSQPSSDSKPRRPWLPLPLRRRNPEGWF
ncbi:Mg2+ transporter protein cora-like protein [Lentinula guzmanii]|uniref:Magnesium transporter n=1 Tax=Lentinula guzmanii TaxID=2804957 RepID=A0AA38MWY7_9AGAR|nr:Mg2+ transporter protein cora-like protein [Lentinula guzmanii]